MIKITAIINQKQVFRLSQLRALSQLAAKHKEVTDNKMQAWQIHCYGGLDELKLTKAKIPVISKPTDVLIKVDASSVNPIDVAMIRSYGSKVLNLMRKAKSSCDGRPYSDIEFPLTLGRDFAGTVVSKGHGVDKFKIGDEVWGVVPVEQQGCHADYVLVNSCLVNVRPTNLSYIEAASILYAGLTAWSALWYTGGMCYKTVFTQPNRRVLVLGGSGGVGTLAIQLLRAWNAQVVTTCSADAVDMLQNLGADVIIDYKESDADSKVISEGPYDIILDCSNQGPDTIKLKGYPHSNYITLNSPMLKNIDQHGLLFGALKNVGDLLKHNIPMNEKQSFVKWGFFTPSPTGIEVIQELTENKQIIPVVQEVYSFEELPKAYERVGEGHLRGKVVIDMR